MWGLGNQLQTSYPKCNYNIHYFPFPLSHFSGAALSYYHGIAIAVGAFDIITNQPQANAITIHFGRETVVSGVNHVILTKTTSIFVTVVINKDIFPHFETVKFRIRFGSQLPLFFIYLCGYLTRPIALNNVPWGWMYTFVCAIPSLRERMSKRTEDSLQQ